jgi:hypothetical protein
MADFKAKVRPELHPAAQELVNIYEATPGSTGPGRCPEALAAVIVCLVSDLRLTEELCGIEMRSSCLELLEKAALLRGEQP